MNKKDTQNKLELILPGGDLKRAKLALDFGADAVYIGLDKHSLRKGGVNFTIKEIALAINYAHSKGKKIYVTFNIFAHNKHLAEIEKDMEQISKLGPDAFIIADIGLIQMAKRLAPNVPIHVSTQANTVNIEDVRFWKSQGVKRVVLARELTLPEIAEIHQAVPEVELEVFVHGAMCISYSGRCLLSNYMTGRQANLGECAQPCRWKYDLYGTKPQATGSRERVYYYLEEQMRLGELFKIESSHEGTAIMSSKDLRLVRYLPEILQAGVTGLKVEGRNKTEYYLGATALAYSEALRLTQNEQYTEKDKKRLEKELEKINYRDYTTGFLLNEAKKGETYPERSPIRKWDYIGIIQKTTRLPNGQKEKINNTYEITVKNKIVRGDQVEVLTPNGVVTDMVQKIRDENNQQMTEINPGRENQKAQIELKNHYEAGAMLRKRFK